MSFFKDAGLHHPDGANIMLLGLDVLPQHRGQGLARELMSRYLARAKEKGQKGGDPDLPGGEGPDV